MIMLARQLLEQLMPTLIWDQVPLAAEALKLVEDSGPSNSHPLVGTTSSPVKPEVGCNELRRPVGTTAAGETTRATEDGDEDTQMPGTETEDETWHISRRKWSATEQNQVLRGSSQPQTPYARSNV